MSKSLLARVPAPVRLGVPVVAAGLLAAACGSAAASSSPGSAASSSPDSAGSAAGGAARTVVAAHPGSGGSFLTVGSRSVYAWTADGMNKSNCMGACAGEWPPVTAHSKVTVSGGAKPSDLGTIARPGGGRQVTYAGHPLYFFAGDSGAGQTSGQGNDSFGAKWWLVAPSGMQITAADTATAAAAAARAPASPAGSSAAMAPASSGGSAGGGWG